MMTSSTTTSTATLWNGPICSTCGARYVGAHQCSAADIARRIRELTQVLDGLTPPAIPAPPVDRTAGCPCRPENGGSGMCGCILSGPTITCGG